LRGDSSKSADVHVASNDAVGHPMNRLATALKVTLAG
jgi:hypothetical protein